MKLSTLSGNPQVKPKWQLPVGVMEGIVAYNCRKHGMPRPVLAIPMWEGAGNRVMDLSGHGNHGTLNGSGWIGNGLNFDSGNNDHISDIGLSITGNFTMVFRASYTPGNSWGMICGDNTSNRDFLGFDNGDFVRFRKAGADMDFNALTSFSEMATYALAENSSTDRDLYKNGLFVQNNTQNTSEPLIVYDIGSGYNNNSLSLNGDMEYYFLYDQALTPAQIKFVSDDPYFMFRIPETYLGYYVEEEPGEGRPRCRVFFGPFRGPLGGPIG